MIARSEFAKKQLVFVFSFEGERVSFKNDNIVVRAADGSIKFQSTCYRIFALFVIGDISITTGLIKRARRFCFTIVLMNSNFHVFDMIGFSAEGNTVLRRLQYTLDDEYKLAIARHLVTNKIDNQAAILRRQRHREESVNETISMLTSLRKHIESADNIHVLMGYEGSCAREYFNSNFNRCEWKGRKARVKSDYVNTTLDIGYTLLFNYVESLLRLYGFDLFVGVLHQQFYMRKSLVCDLVEPFRPLVDYQIRKSISLGQCKPDDFAYTSGAFALKRNMNKDYLLFLSQPLIARKEEIFDYIRQYYRAFATQAAPESYPVFEMG